VTQHYLQSNCSTIGNQFAHLYLNSTCNLLAQNLQSTCSLVSQFYLQSTCTQFAITLLFVTRFYLRSTHLQLTILLLAKLLQVAYTLPANLQSVALCLQLQLAYKLPAICNPLLFAYNFNWHSNCLQFTINLLFAHYNFNWHSNCLQLAIRCSLPTTSTGIQIAYNLQSTCLCKTTSIGIQIACNLQSVALAYNFNWHTNCLQCALRCSLPTTSNVIQRSAICNPFAVCLQLLLACKCPQFAIRLLVAYDYYWHSNCPQICNPFALCLQQLFRNSILGLASTSCTMPEKGELWHFSDHMRTLSCHQLHLVCKTCPNLNGVAVLYPVQAFKNVIFDHI